MPVSIIPFAMPEPAEIPAHIAAALREMPADEAVRKGMDLLMQIEAAETMVYERLDGDGRPRLIHVAGGRAAALRAALTAADSFVREAAARDSALLLMGEARAGEESALPAGVVDFLLSGAESGSIGFNYVLPLRGREGRIRGGLTLLRRAADGPLNHEQPHICEAMCRQLGALLGD